MEAGGQNGRAFEEIGQWSVTNDRLWPTLPGRHLQRRFDEEWAKDSLSGEVGESCFVSEEQNGRSVSVDWGRQ